MFGTQQMLKCTTILLNTQLQLFFKCIDFEDIG